MSKSLILLGLILSINTPAFSQAQATDCYTLASARPNNEAYNKLRQNPEMLNSLANSCKTQIDSLILDLQKFPATIDNYQNKFQEIAQQFKAEGKLSAAKFYYDFSQSQVVIRATELTWAMNRLPRPKESLGLVRDNQELPLFAAKEDPVAVAAKYKTTANLKDYVAKLVVSLNQTKMQLDGIVSAEPAYKKIAALEYDTNFGGLLNSGELLSFINRTLNAENPLLFNTSFYNLTKIDQSCFPSDDSFLQSFWGKDAFAAQIGLVGSENEVIAKRARLAVNLLTQREFAAAILEKGIKITCEHVDFKSSETYRWITDFNRELIENSPFENFKASTQFNSASNTINIKKAKLIYDDGVRPKPFYLQNNHEVPKLLSTTLQEIKASMGF